MKVLGIDPGSTHTGYALLEGVNSHLECLAIGRISPQRSQKFPQRLLAIYERIQELLACYHPDAMAVEDVFSGINARTALRLGQARGIVLLAAAKARIDVYDYPPMVVKKAVVGQGRASKSQVSFMVQRLLNLPQLPEQDAADALALAICHLYRGSRRQP